jgi:hypothetical protein
MPRTTRTLKTEVGCAIDCSPKPTWERCSEAWCDVGVGNSLAIFHDATSRLYRVEMELGAECVDLVALLCELSFAQRWCPFVKLSQRVMDTDYIMNDTMVCRLVLHPACLIVIGVMVLYIKQTQFNSDVAVCIRCEDMHRSRSTTTSASYVAFETFDLVFEKEVFSTCTIQPFDLYSLEHRSSPRLASRF